MIQVFKCLHGMYICSGALLTLHQSEERTTIFTRGHSLKLLKPFSRLRSRQAFFSQRAVNLWNSPPESAVTVTELLQELSGQGIYGSDATFRYPGFDTTIYTLYKYYKSDTVTPRMRTHTSIGDVTNEQSIGREASSNDEEITSLDFLFAGSRLDSIGPLIPHWALPLAPNYSQNMTETKLACAKPDVSAWWYSAGDCLHMYLRNNANLHVPPWLPPDQ